MRNFATIAELIESAPAAVWVDSDGVSGFVYDSEEAMEEHGRMGAAGDPSAPMGTERFELTEHGDLTQALIAAGIAYESN